MKKMKPDHDHQSGLNLRFLAISIHGQRGLNEKMQKCTGGPSHPTGHSDSVPWRALAWLLRGMGAAGSNVLSLGPHSRLDARQPCLLLTAFCSLRRESRARYFSEIKSRQAALPWRLEFPRRPPTNDLKSQKSEK